MKLTRRPKSVLIWMSKLDIQMSRFDTHMSRLDTRMSMLDIRMSKVILEFEKNKAAKNLKLNVAFRIFFADF